MDYTKEIQELKADRAELEAELKTKGISEQMKHVIHQRIIAIDTRITAFFNKLPPPVDFQQWAGFVIPCSVGIFLLTNRKYMSWRHVKIGGRWKYSQQQFNRREFLFTVLNAPLTGEVKLDPKLYSGLSHESVGCALIFGACWYLADLVRRSIFWQGHRSLLPLKLPVEEDEGTILEWDPFKPTAVIRIRGEDNIIQKDLLRLRRRI